MFLYRRHHLLCLLNIFFAVSTQLSTLYQPTCTYIQRMLHAAYRIIFPFHTGLGVYNMRSKLWKVLINFQVIQLLLLRGISFLCTGYWRRITHGRLRNALSVAIHNNFRSLVLFYYTRRLMFYQKMQLNNKLQVISDLHQEVGTVYSFKCDYKSDFFKWSRFKKTLFFIFCLSTVES